MKLYKYRAVNRHSLDILNENRIYFAHPEQFNDPFEGKLAPQIKPGEEEGIATAFDEIGLWKPNVEELLPRLRKIAKTSSDHRLIDDFAKESLYTWILKNSSSEDFRSLFNRSLQDAIKSFFQKTSVCTFSETCNNILMYAHYSDSHRGFCIGFELDEYPNPDTFVRQVVYSKDFQNFEVTAATIRSINEGAVPGGFVETMVLTKSHDWAYEREWRAFRRASSGVQDLPENAIVSIIFGCRMPDSDKQLIRKLLTGREIQFYQAQIEDQTFGLRIESL